jgi:hypothetical protein
MVLDISTFKGEENRVALKFQNLDIDKLKQQIKKCPQFTFLKLKNTKFQECYAIVYFFLVGGCVRHLQNPATKCHLPIGYWNRVTNREIAYRCRI